jgi:hypothetical protein
MSPVSLDIYTQSNTKIINFTMKGCRSFYKLTKQLWEKSISRLKLLSVLCFVCYGLVALELHNCLQIYMNNALQILIMKKWYRCYFPFANIDLIVPIKVLISKLTFLTMVWRFKIWFNPPFLWKCLYQVRVITVFTVFRLLTDFVCLYNYEFWLSLCNKPPALSTAQRFRLSL